MTGENAPCLFLSYRVQHIFDKNSVAFRRTIYQNMRYRSNDFSVLDNGTAAHE